jgi:LacI family transcriptional regulator
MTVSRVINGDAKVRQSTRDAVTNVIRELGYLPNRAARGLASASQVQISMLYDNPSSSYLSAMLLGVLEQARRSDTQIVVVECDDEADGIRCIRNMLSTGIDGIILSPPLADSPAVLKLVEESGIQCVTIGTRREEAHISSVSIDDFAAAELMTAHIIRLGHRRIGFIKGSPDQLATPLRLAGYSKALADAGIEYDPELVVEGRFSYRSGLDATEKLLALERRPTAIFARGSARIKPATTAMATSSRVSSAPSARRGNHLMITSQFMSRS